MIRYGVAARPSDTGPRPPRFGVGQGLVPVWPGDGTIAITARVDDPETTPAEVLAVVTCHDDGTCDVDADLARTVGRAYFAAMREAGLC